MSESIRDALKKLDPSNDGQWTADKLPAVDAVNELLVLGDGAAAATRKEITAAAEGFTRDTAAAYWLTIPAATAPAEPAAQAPAGPSTVATPWGGGGNEPPQPAGAGAAPQAETQAAEGAETSADSEGALGGGSDSEGEAEQPEVESTGADDGEDELASLESELEATQDAVTERQQLIERLKGEIAQLASQESNIIRQIDAIKPKVNANANAIQDYLASQRKQLQARGVRKAMIAESGIDLRELTANLKSPIDASMSRKTGRGGQRPKR